jgi:hypothetical protein
LNDFASLFVGSSGRASSLVVHCLRQIAPLHRWSVVLSRLVKADSCGDRMRRQTANAVRRSLRSCNLLPNVDRPITSDRSVLKLVVSVANFWGNIRRVDATIRRFAGRRTVNRFSALTMPIFGMWQSTRFEQCLDDVMMSWSTPAPAAQAISSSTRSQRIRVSFAPYWAALRSTLAEEC